MSEFFKGGGEGAQRAMSAMMKMKKLNIAELERAAEGED
jgi:predicted 3-demethylubiquinone-9 3-methyltransferase (glyoxalase superfamily)